MVIRDIYDLKIIEIMNSIMNSVKKKKRLQGFYNRNVSFCREAHTTVRFHCAARLTRPQGFFWPHGQT